MWNWTGPDSNSPAPPGVVPDFDHPVDVAWTRNVAIMVVCDALVTLFFAIRIYAKIRINPRLLADDYTCAIAYCLIILYTATVFMMAHYGAGYYSWEIRPPAYFNLLKWLYANTVVYCPAAFFTKVTILLLMARVFAVEERLSRAIYVFIWALLVAYIPLQVIKTVVCTPIRALWDPTVRQHVRCVDQRKVFFGDVALAMLTDTLILLVPIPPTWRLHMPLRKKVKIVALLGAGGVATAITIFRTYKVAKFVGSNDLTVDYVDIDILACLEITIGFVCACLPSLNLLIERHLSQRRRRMSMQQAPPTSWPRPKSFLCRDRTSRTTPAMARSDWNASTVNDDMHPAITNFDMELAMLTGEPMGRRPPQRSDSDHPARLSCRSVDSLQGRRDGWLSEMQPAGAGGESYQDAEFIMRMVERSRMISEQGPKESWCPVWDGPRDHKQISCTSTQLADDANDVA